MRGLVMEFADDVTEEGFLDEREYWLRVPRRDYLGLIETARQVRAEWTFREGADFVCETCKSFIVPAQGFLRLMRKLENARANAGPDDYLQDTIVSHLTKPYPMTDEAWKAYCEGKLRHIPFIHNAKGELGYLPRSAR